MRDKCLENQFEKVIPAITANETEYLTSMMTEIRQEGYTCVSGCQDCVSCGGNDSSPRG